MAIYQGIISNNQEIIFQGLPIRQGIISSNQEIIFKTYPFTRALFPVTSTRIYNL
jgi:hypothetical protein